MDIILVNGKIYTMDGDRNVGEAVAIKGDTIETVGTSEEILKLREDHTIVYDLKGKIIVPGFNDSHMHLLNYGITLTLVDLRGTNSVEDVNEKVCSFIKEKKIEAGKWIRGRGWNQDYFIGKKVFPTRYDLDEISSEHPIIVTRACGHVAVANSKALEILNINKNTPQVDGGHFDLDENGEPLGIFRENAIDMIYKEIPSPTVEDIKDMMMNAIMELNKVGITSVGSDDLGTLSYEKLENVIFAYRELQKENRLNIRVYEQCLIPEINVFKEFIDKGYTAKSGDKFFKIGPLKLLIDGSLGARTAAMVEPYSDDPNETGIITATQEELDDIVKLAHDNDFQVAIHGIGDRAMYMAFESIEKALEKNPRSDHRHGIVHCQITDEILLDKFAELNAVAYIQPIFLDYDWKIVKDRVGEEREKTSYNWKTMVEKNIAIACGSDAPVETFDVMKGIYEAVTRKDLDGNPTDGWLPNQKLTVDEALYGYTMGGAYASFEENEKGSLEKGKLADMVVLSEDIFNIPEDSIKDVEIQATILGGKLVYGKIN